MDDFIEARRRIVARYNAGKITRYEMSRQLFEAGRVHIPDDELDSDLLRVRKEGVGWLVQEIERQDHIRGLLRKAGKNRYDSAQEE